MTGWICRTCAVEQVERTDVCTVCSDERQYVPAGGTRWTTMQELAEEGHRLTVRQVEPGLHGISVQPTLGIGQQAMLVQTEEGSVLWDPTGFLDDAGVREVRQLGRTLAIVASHPHMYGAQVAWSRALGDPPVLVAEADRHWVRRDDPAITTWSGTRQLAEGLTLQQTGGHFPGSAVLHWAAGAGGRGVLLGGDTVAPNPDGATIAFMRSFPNRLPLSGAVVDRVTTTIEAWEFDRVYGNFGNSIVTDARAALRRSADRHIAWVRGDFDHLT